MKNLIPVFVLGTCVAAYGSVSPKNMLKNYSMVQPRGLKQAATVKYTVQALSLPLGNSIEALAQQRVQGYKNLLWIAFESDKALNLKWRAVFAMAILGGSRSEVDLLRAIESDRWYLRAAGLSALARVDRAQAKQKARDLLSDVALVVRSKAVQVLRHLKDSESVDLLWQKLYSQDSFRREKGLWIRRQIVEALAELSPPGSETQFIRVLSESDAQLYPAAIRGLNKMTKLDLGANGESIKERRRAWLEWWKQINKSTAG